MPVMSTISADTSPDSERVLLQLARDMAPRQKLDIAASMSRTLRQLAESGVRARHPDAPEEEISKRLAARMLPRDLVIAAYDWDPEKEGY